MSTPKLQPVRGAHGTSAQTVNKSSHWGRRHVRKRHVLRKKRKQNGGDTWKISSLGTWLETRSRKEALPDRGVTPSRDWGCPTPGQVHHWGTVAHGCSIPEQGHPWGNAAMGDPHWCRGKQVRSSRKTLGRCPQPAVPPVASLRGLGGYGNTCGDGGGWDQEGGGEESDWSQAWGRGRKGVSLSVHLIAFFSQYLSQ